LGDVFSGIVLSFSRPYRPGDWVNLEGGTDGRVIEMNWRATYILTGRRDLAIVPNSTIAKSKIVNVSSPSGIHGTTVTVQIDAETPPATGSEILDHAILNCRLIVANPAPTVAVKTINASYTEFDITFFVEELASSTKAQNELFDLIFRHLAAAGIGLASPQSQPGSLRQTHLATRGTGPKNCSIWSTSLRPWRPRNGRRSRQAATTFVRQGRNPGRARPCCNRCSLSAAVFSRSLAMTS
jgi:small-conductance mechanosensitive channel